MIRKGTRVKITAVAEQDAFYSDNYVGRTGVAKTTLRNGGDTYYYGGITLDMLPGDDFQRNPWFGYVKVKVITKRRKK